MRKHLKLDDLPLATTDAGKRFVMKALHPADHEIKATRIPGGIDNTVALQIDEVFSVPLSKNRMRLILAPLIDTPVMIEQTIGDTDTFVGSHSFQPPVLGGRGLVSYDDARGFLPTLRRNFESLVITSESATVDFIAPALNNQGSVVAAQFPCNMQKFHAQCGEYVSGESSGYHPFSLDFGVIDDYPKKSEALSGTRAYSGQMINGCYMPLRLSKLKPTYLNSSYLLGLGQSAQQDTGGSTLPTRDPSSAGYFSDRVGMGTGQERICPLGDTWGIMYFDDYTVGTAIRVRFRMTLEARVYPGTSYASLAEPPPVPDAHAIKMYKEIAGRLVNAYPSSYNDWNQLKRTILSVANEIVGGVAPWLPTALKALPYGSALSAIAAPALQGAQSWLKSKLGKSTPGAVVPYNPAIQQPSAAKSPKRKRKRSKRNKGNNGTPAQQAANTAAAIVKAMQKLN